MERIVRVSARQILSDLSYRPNPYNWSTDIDEKVAIVAEIEKLAPVREGLCRDCCFSRKLLTDNQLRFFKEV